MKNIHYQVGLEQTFEDGTKRHLVLWLPEKCNKIGLQVELKDEPGLWKVTSTGLVPRELSELHQNQKWNNNI